MTYMPLWRRCAAVRRLDESRGQVWMIHTQSMQSLVVRYAVNAGTDSPAAFRIARLTAVRAICTL